MDFTNCKGIQAKKQLVDKYNIKPIAYIRLLNGQSKQGCCGKITDRYYVFEYESRDNNETGSFFTGYSCGEQFLELLGINKDRFKLFNPFYQIPNNANRNYNRAIRYDNGYKNLKDPLNQEVYNAINLVFAIWDKIPISGTKIAKILDFVTRVNIRTQDFAVVEVNNLVGKDYKSRTLDEIVSEIAINNNIRNFEFPLMKKIITRLIQSGEVVRNKPY